MISEETKLAIDGLNAGIKNVKEIFYNTMDGIKENLADLSKNMAVFGSLLKSIDEQTKRTNGRVNGLETQYHDLEKKHIQCPVSEVVKRLDHLEKFKSEAEDLLLDIRWRKQNPEESKKLDIGRIILMIGVIAALGTGIATFIKLFL